MTDKKQPATTHIMLKDPEIRRRLEECATRERRSMNAVVLTALERYLDDMVERAAAERQAEASASQHREGCGHG